MLWIGVILSQFARRDFAGLDLTPKALVNVIRHNDENDTTINKILLAFQRWDGDIISRLFLSFKLFVQEKLHLFLANSEKLQPHFLDY